MRVSSLLFLCALCLSGTAAYYSIVGLAAIFSAAFWPVVAMASILEISKLVVASWLYQKWTIIPGFLKGYLTSAVIILMFITSLGIFGFLTKAHVEQGLSNQTASLRIDQLTNDINRHRETISRYQTQLQQLDRAINIQLDANRAAQASATRRTQEAERTTIRSKIDGEETQISTLSAEKNQWQQQLNVLESKVGPIRYVAEFFASGKNIDLDQAVRYMIVILVIVFDPLAVLMLIAANMSLLRERKTTVVENVTVDPAPIAVAPPTGPVIGEIRIDPATNASIWFDGETWRRVEIQLVQSSVENSRLGPEEIKNVVKDTMDMWLTTAVSQTQATTDDIKIRDPSHDTQSSMLDDRIDAQIHRESGHTGQPQVDTKPVGREWL